MSNSYINTEHRLDAPFKVDSISKTEDGAIRVSGYANTVNKDRAGDVIPASTWKTPAAKASIAGHIPILAQHDHARPTGKVVKATPTNQGLHIEAEIHNIDEPTYKAVKAGILNAFSIGFRLLDGKFHQGKSSKDEGYYVISDLELFEVSVVSVPCNAQSTFNLGKSLVSGHQKGITNAPNEVISIRDTIRESSDLVNALVSVESQGENALVTYNEVDGVEELKGVRIPTTGGTVQRTLTTETSEDAAFNIRNLFEENLINAAALQIENQMSQRLVDRARNVTSGSSSKNFGTVLELYKGFDRKVRQTAGVVYVVGNFDTIETIINGNDYFQSDDLIRDRFEFIISEEMEDTELVMGHEIGIFGRLISRRGIEEERIGLQDKSIFTLGYYWGLEVDQDYVIKRTVAA